MNHVVDIIDALAAPVAWVVITVIVMRGLPAVIAGLAPNQDVKKVKGGPGGGEVEFYPSPSEPDPPQKYSETVDRPVVSPTPQEASAVIRLDDESRPGSER